eukprot:jgi/Mesvir1/17267/Mv07676-RA.1
MGRAGKAGFGPARPGKPGKPGQDGRAGRPGKNGKKGEPGTRGVRAADVVLRLSGSGPQDLTATGQLTWQQPDGAPPLVLPLVVRRLMPVPPDPAVLEKARQLAEEAKAKVAAGGAKVAPPPPPPPVTFEEVPLLPGARFSLDNPRSVLLVKAAGGRGGDGGHGGRGGDGGNGGHGGNGGAGGNGKKGMKPGWNGEWGGHGGPGGKGASGGDGGMGNDGGKGANGGGGGHVIVESVDPRLFMLVEVDARAGRPGYGGNGGAAGQGGQGGLGGAGGMGGTGGPPWDKLYLPRYGKTKYYTCYKGQNGIQGVAGNRGLTGAPGLPGQKGEDGKPANDGKVTFKLLDAQGNTVTQAKDRYNCTTMSFRVRSSTNDGVCAPGKRLLVDKVR